MTGVMEGVRVLEVAEHAFVPGASAILADWGAEVIKVEHVERGDAMRGLMATGLAGAGGGVHVLMEHANRGKQSIALDLTKPDGVDLVHRLAAMCDVFLTNKLPAVRAKLGIDVEEIRGHRPDVIYVRGSGYGPSGPDADAGGYDFLAFWARAGTAESCTPSDLAEFRVVQPGPGYGDSLGSMTIAGGIAAALFHRQQTGEGSIVDVSLLATGMWALGGAIALSQQSGVPWRSGPTTSVGTPLNPLTGMYRTANGRFIAFSMLQGFHYWSDVCTRLGRNDLITDDRFDDQQRFMANGVVGSRIMADELATHTLEDLKARFTGMRGQWAIVQNTADIAKDPQVVANGYLQRSRTADGTEFTLVAPPVQFDEVAASPGCAPAFNEHGDGILTELLGLDWETVIDLKTRGIVA